MPLERLLGLLALVIFAVAGVLLLASDEGSLELRTGVGTIAIGLALLTASLARPRAP